MSPSPNPPPQPSAILSQCSHCHIPRSASTPILYICTGCRLTRYCSRAHQVSHWPHHKSLCNRIKTLKRNLDFEELRIRTNPPSFSGHPDWPSFYMPGNPFEHGIDFYQWEPTRKFLEGKVEYMRLVVRLGALEEGEKVGWEVLKLNRSDDLGVRRILPGVMVRLGNDRGAYDFLKWWCIHTKEGCGYDWGDPDVGYLDYEGEDVGEELESGGWDGERLKEVELGDLVNLCLVKVRLWLRMRKDECVVVERKDSASTLLCEQRLEESSTTASSPTFEDLAKREQSMTRQIETLFNIIQRRNQHFWRDLVAGQDHISRVLREHADKSKAVSGSEDEAQNVLDYTYEAWKESAGAIEWVQDKLKTIDYVETDGMEQG